MVVAASFSEYLDKLHIDVANALDQLEGAERSGDPDRIRAVREWLDLGLPDWRDKLEAHRAWLAGPEQVARREQAAREAEDRAAAVSLELDRQFYDSLAGGDPVRVCARDGCPGRAVRFSRLCRRHHFEKLRGYPLPFEE